MGTITSGAENDLKQATHLARRMVLDWGMGKELQHLALGSQSTNVFLGQDIAYRREYSEETANAVDKEIMDILDGSFTRASETLSEHRQALDRLAEALLEREELDGSDVLALLKELDAIDQVPAPFETDLETGSTGQTDGSVP